VSAAEAGLKTLVVDRKSTVGVPIRCGEAVSEDVVQDRGIKLNDDLVRNYVKAGMFESSAGRKLEVCTSNRGVLLNRTRFEQHIVDRAGSAGATVALRTQATGLSKSGIKINGDNIKCRFIIGADGIESVIGHWAGLPTALTPKDIGVCAQYVVSKFEMQDDRVEMYWGDKFTMGGGYAWVFPRGDGSANVGLGVTGSQVPKEGMKFVLDRFLGIRCGKNYKTGEFQVASIPQAAPMDKAVKNNVILVGDAAHMAIPLTGSGIGHALFSGKLAVDTITDMLDNGYQLDHLQNYDIAWKKKMGKKILRAYKIKEKFRKDPRSIERFFKVLKPLEVLHRYFPNFIERTALRDFRY
jgi:digeranylgeranylglycerophospholipid reductase